MARQPKERLSAVPSQPTGDIDEEILGVNGVRALEETGDNDDDEDPRPNASPPTIPVSQAKRVGAVNAEAVSSNRRRKQVLQRKLAGEKNVPWGEQDACLLYDDIIVVWPPQHLLVHVTRISGGSRTSEYLRSQPRNGMELHDAIKQQIHGRAPEAEYQIVYRDRAGKEERGRGSILMPSTESDMLIPPPPAPQQPPPAPAAAQPLPAPPQAPPPQYPQPPPMNYPPHRDDTSWGPPPQSRWGRPAPEDLPPRIPPVQQQQPMQQNPDPVVVMNLQRQLSDIQAQLQGLGRVANNPMQQQLSDIQARLDALSHSPNAPSPASAAPPANPMQQQLSDLHARLDALTRAPNVPPAAPAAPPPAPVKMPEVPPGYAMTMINGLPCFVPLRDLSPALGAPPAPAAPVAQAQVPLQPLQPLPQQAPPPPMSPGDHFAQTIGMVRSAVEAAQSIRNILPDQAPAPVAAVPEAPEPDESPTKVVKIGDVNTIQNVADGSIRPVDTLIANLPGIVSWVDKQRNEILARQAAAQSGTGVLPPSGGSSIGAPTIPGR